MTHWEITEPQTVDLQEVHDLRLSIVAGDVSVTATDGPSRLEVHSHNGAPLQVDLQDGVLTIAYEDLPWGGIFDWLVSGRKNRREVSLALAVPADCEVKLGTVSADAVVSGITEPTTVHTVSGEITLDGLGGGISAKTVSGNVESVALAGDLSFETVSGDLTVASGRCHKLTAKTVSGDVIASMDVEDGAELAVVTVSGDVVLRLPATSAGAHVGVDTVSGRLTSGLAGVTTTSTPGRRRLEGSFGAGVGTLRVKTVSGDVDILSATAS